VIVGVHRRFPSPLSGEKFVRSTRNHLIYVHVGGRARSGLEHIHNELIVELAFLHLTGRGHNAPAEVGMEKPEFGIHLGRMFLDQSNGLDEAGGELKAADGEVLPGRWVCAP
jgi:hypothetical protein